MNDKILTVDLTRRLPDIDSYKALPPEYDDYGRFAVLRTGAIWNGPITSSHPPMTRDGFYWALSGDTLSLSPRGSTMGWPQIMTNKLIRWIARRIGLKRRYSTFRVYREDTDR